MVNNSIRDLVIRRSTQKAVHVECSNEVSDDILKILEEQHPSAGFVFRDDELYEKLKVKEYLSLFDSISGSGQNFEKAVQAMHLTDCLNTVISKLSYGHKRRIAIAREIIKDSELIYIQEPLLNLDENSTHYILKWVEEDLPDDRQVITSSVSLKKLFLLEGSHYYADEYGVKPLQSSSTKSDGSETQSLGNEQIPIPEISIEALIEDKIKEVQSQNESETVNKVKLVDKISAHYEDKILLFNPNDIDYVESVNGKAHINIRGNAFPASYTMEELEKELGRYSFFRCHRSYLVNMQKVEEIIRWTRNSYSLRLEGLEDASIPLSKGRIEELRATYKF